MSSATGKEIAAHRAELEAVLGKIMREHTVRCAVEGTPCAWASGAMDAILCDLEQVMERYHVRAKAAA